MIVCGFAEIASKVWILMYSFDCVLNYLMMIIGDFVFKIILNMFGIF